MSRTTSFIMRPVLLILLVSLAFVGCDEDVSGTYSLVSWDGQELPYSFELWDTVTVTSVTLVMHDSTFELAVTSEEDGELPAESGTFSLSESNVICFSPSSGEAPFSSRGDTESPECVGTWDGDEITIADDETTLVFRR